MSVEVLERVGTVEYDGIRVPVLRVRCSVCRGVYERKGSRSTVLRSKSCFGCHVRLRKQPAHGARGRFVRRPSVSAPQGKGRGGKSETEKSRDRQDDRARVAKLPTRQPRPDWMRDPKQLPKEPPNGKRRNDR